MTLSWPAKDRERPARGTAADLRVVEHFEPSALTPLGDGQGTLPLTRPTKAGENLLVFGDNGLAMEALADRVGGAIDLIYIDPPYATGLNYFSQTGRGGANMEHRAYSDALVGGMAGYADTMYARLAAMHALLDDQGKIFVHCDWRANAVLRLILDEIFGTACFRNEIIWRRAPNLGRQAASKQLGRVLDTIFVYSKTEGAAFAGPVPRRRALVPLDGKGKPKGARWDEERKLYFTTAPRGDYTDRSIAKLREEGRIYDSSGGKVYIKYFLTKGDDGRWYKEQPVDALWDDYAVRPLRHRPKSEAMGYDTQKPEGLLERIIGWATQPGDLVADFFCGSGTTMAVAQAMGRRWLGCDRQRPAIEISRRRLGGAGARFDVCSVERAERKLWRAEQIDDAAAVLEAFGAEPSAGRWGNKEDARVFVGPADEAMTEGQISEVCAEAGEGRVIVLGWAWSAHDGGALRQRMKREHGVELVMRTIPSGLMRAVSPRKLRFLERPEVELEVVPANGSRELAVRITNVRCPAPSRLREDKSNKGNKKHEAELSWSDYIDSWRVDFDGAASRTFTPTWQGLRGEEGLPLSTPARHFESTTTVLLKVLTVFGDEIDRTIVIEC